MMTPPDAGSAAARALPGKGELVLVVDDDDNLRTAVARMLRSLGFAAITAVDGADALAVIDATDRPVDAVLVDVLMPRLGGPELVERLAQRGIHPGVIYMSGYDDPAILARVPKTPTTTLLRKPFTLHSLVLVLRDVLDHHTHS